jgi:hypothetical protein
MAVRVSDTRTAVGSRRHTGNSRWLEAVLHRPAIRARIALEILGHSQRHVVVELLRVVFPVGEILTPQCELQVGMIQIKCDARIE